MGFQHSKKFQIAKRVHIWASANDLQVDISARFANTINLANDSCALLTMLLNQEIIQIYPVMTIATTKAGLEKRLEHNC